MNTIVVSLCGGLGNQLFQYAIGRALALRKNADLVVDIAWFEDVKSRNGTLTTQRYFALEPFHLMYLRQSIGLPNQTADGFHSRVLRRVLRHIPRKRNGVPIYTERGFTFDRSAFELSAPVWLDGYWQSHRYFDDVAATIRAEIATPMELDDGSKAMLLRIKSCDAICLHVRRGDYVTNVHAASTHGLCGLEYYHSGVQVAVNGLKMPHCFVFSDDPEWVRSHLRLPLPMTIVDVNGPDAAHQDLWLMSACRRFVIANSSLSWWGAWLGAAADKVVVAPKKWFVNNMHDTRDLIPADWVRL